MTTLVENKTIEFEKLIPDFKRFAFKYKDRMEAKRLILTYVYYDGQYLIATDSHRLIRINAEYVSNLPSNDPFLYDLNNKKLVTSEKNYPNTNRLIPDNYQTSIYLDSKLLKEIKNHTNEICSVVKGKPNNVMNLDVTNSIITLKDREDKYKADLECNTSGENIDIYFNSKYFKDVLISVGKLNKLSSRNPELSIVGKMRPFNIKLENIYDIIILPVRVY